MLMTEVNMTDKNYFLVLGQNIKYYRNRKNMSKAELAKLIKVQEKYIDEVENGKRVFTMKTLEKIVNALDVTFVDIFNPNLNK